MPMLLHRKILHLSVALNPKVLLGDMSTSWTELRRPQLLILLSLKVASFVKNDFFYEPIVVY